MMCYYRYYYFLGCRHQQTALFDFCDRAQPLLGNEKEDDNDSQGKREDRQREAEDTVATAEGDGQVGVTNEESTDDADNIDPPSAHLSTVNISSNQSFPSPDIGSRSIIAEPGIDQAHPQPAAQPRSYSAALREPPHDMAGLPLPLFGFRQWMTGGSAAPPQSASAPEGNDASVAVRSVLGVSDRPYPSSSSLH